MTASFPIFAPNTGLVFDRWQSMSNAEVARTLAIVDHGLHGLESIETRRRVLLRCVEALTSRRRELAELIVQEVGKKPDEALGEVDYAASFLGAARAALDELSFEWRPEPERLIREVPYRVALLIAPFNDPLAGLTRKIGPALAAGATALVKPSRLGILCARALMESLHEAGADEFVQLIAPEDNECVEALIADHRIGVVSFTGSTGVGRRLAAAAAHEGKRIVLELGGNCPFVICEDAPLDLALDDLMTRKLKAAGQACSSVNRVFVAAPRYAEVRERLLERVARLETGPSDEPGVDLGPLRTCESTRALNDAVDAALCAGERLLSPRAFSRPSRSPFPVSVDGGGMRRAQLVRRLRELRAGALHPLLRGPRCIAGTPGDRAAHPGRLLLHRGSGRGCCRVCGGCASAASGSTPRRFKAPMYPPADSGTPG